MRLSELELGGWDWRFSPPPQSLVSRRLSKHQSEIAQQEENALSVPPELLSVQGRVELGYDERTEDELLTLRMRDAQRRAKRAVKLGSKPDIERQAAAERKKRREFEALLAQALGEQKL